MTPTAIASFAPFVAGFWQSVFSSWGSVMLVLLGTVTIALSLVAFVQTRTWPRATTTDLIRIAFPDIAEHHPDVWGHDDALVVVVHIDRDRFAADASAQVVLSGQTDGHRRVFGTVDVPSDGRARFSVLAARRGEVDLVAALHIDSDAEGQAVRAIRLVDYRAEVIETFEDFVAWAANQFGFVDRKRTAREFVDMFIDGRPGVPAAPLDEIVDIYEVANFSDHPVDRTTYLRLVDAFLTLEEAGALEGTEEP